MGGKKKDSRRKKKKRSNGDDSSSSSSDDSEEDENDELKNKLLAKATKKLVAQMKTDSVAGGLYTDEKNPFNDENLTEKFVWSKKIEKEGKKAVQNLTDKDAQLEREEEIKKIELRRIEYEKARAEREEERDQKMREKAMEGAEELEEKEEKFHFNQLLLRADIRYKNGRAKPIDTLLRALYGSAFTSALKSEKELAAMKAFNKEFDSKNSLFKYMTEKDLQGLKDECVNVLKLVDETSEKEKEYKLFWTCVYRLTETELNEGGEEEEDKLTEMDEEMMESVDLSGSLEELTDLEQEISRSINEDLDDDTEISFWRKAMKRVTLAKLNKQCKETLAKVYEESKKNIKFVVVEKKDGKEEKENYDNDEDDEDDEDLLGGDDFAKRVRDDKDVDDGKEEEDDDEEEDDEEEEDEEALLANIDVTYGDEPKPLSKEESAKLLKLYEEQQQQRRGEGEDLMNVQEVIVLIDEEEDAENLRRLRAAACEKFAKEQLEKKLEKQRRYQQERMKRHRGRKISSDNDDDEDKDQEEEKEKKTPEEIQQEAADLEEELKAKRYAEKQMGKLADGDIAFTGEVEQKDLGDRELYWWHNKYKPRKPRYFNRVHTGYEWNKYNSTHYDHDNPPPKTVQGYKFNVFYPDLIDSSKAPMYTCERDVSAVNDDTCILKISSGPPYEDVAFRIVNKEWEYSHKRGFKCTFERGIFHLYVNFKRPRYRR
ncbi:unnamed protein product [Bathycoccus prasinos]